MLRLLVDQSIILLDMYNTQSKFVFKDNNDLCSCYVSKANMIQCKHDICVNQKFDISKIGKCWWKRKHISQSLHKGNYNSSTIIKYQSMITDIENDEIFIHSKINNDNELMNVNDNYISNELKIENFLPENKYLIYYIRLYVKIYTVISNSRAKYPIMVLVCYFKLAMSLIVQQIKLLC